MLALAAHVRYDSRGTPIPEFQLNHVLRASDVYLVPRSNGRILVGSTVEEAGFDKRVDPQVIRRLHAAASALVPAVAAATILESWAGLRPGTPDELPILGQTEIKGYFIATGHYREGILLAPITAQLMAQVIQGVKTDFDLSAFSPARFARG
jgi:glycine oxidase